MSLKKKRETTGLKIFLCGLIAAVLGAGIFVWNREFNNSDEKVLQAFYEEMHPNNRLKHQYADQSGINSVEDMGYKQNDDYINLRFGNYRAKISKDLLLTEEWLEKLRYVGVEFRMQQETEYTCERPLAVFYKGEPLQEWVN